MTPKEKTAESIRILKIIEERVDRLVERNSKTMAKNLNSKFVLRQEFRIKDSGTWDTNVICFVPASKKEPVEYYWYALTEYYVQRSSKSYDNCGRGFYLIHTEYPGTLFDFTPHLLSRTSERLLSDSEKLRYAMFGEEYKIVKKVRDNAQTDNIDEKIDNEMKRHGIMNPRMKITGNKKIVHVGKLEKEDTKKMLCVVLNMMSMESLKEIHEKKDEHGNNYLTVHMRAGQLEGFLWKKNERTRGNYPEGYVCFKTFVDNEMLKNDQIAYSTQIDKISTVTNVEEEIYRRMKNASEVSQSEEEKERLIFQKDMAIRKAREKDDEETDRRYKPVKLPDCFMGSVKKLTAPLENELKKLRSTIFQMNR